MQEQTNPQQQYSYNASDIDKRREDLINALSTIQEQYNETISSVDIGIDWGQGIAGGIPPVQGFRYIYGLATGQIQAEQETLQMQRELLGRLEARMQRIKDELFSIGDEILDTSPYNPKNRQQDVLPVTPEGSPNYISAMSQIDSGASPSTALSTPAEDVLGLGTLDEAFEPEWKPPVGMHTLSVDQIREILTTGRLGGGEVEEESETGLSDEDIRNLLIEEGYNDEEVQQLMDEMHAAVADPVAAWEQLQADVAAFKDGVAEATKPIPWTTWAKIWGIQTMTGMGEAFEPYMEHWARPITGFAIGGIGSLLPGESQWEKEYWQRRESGEADWWHASGEAWEEWDINWVGKLASEIICDPVSYIGFGVSGSGKVIPGLAKAAEASGGRVGVYSNLLGRISPKLGVGLNTLEMGFISTVEKPFIALKDYWAKLPKTSTQIARITSHYVVKNAISLIDDVAKLTGKPRVLMSADEVTANLVKAIEKAVINPLDGKWGKVGRELINAFTPYFTVDEFTKLAKAVGVEAGEVSTRQLTEASRIVGLLPGGGGKKVLTYKEAASYLAGVITKGQKSLTDDELKILEDLIRLRVRTAADVAKSVVQAAKGAPAKSIFKNLYTRVHAESLAKASSPVFLQEFRMGKLGGFIRSMEQGRLRYFNAFRMSLDHHLTMPFARSYLLFINYGPFNYLETWFKCGFGGAGWQFRVGANEINKAQMLHGGLLNTPYDIVTFTPRIGFREIWRKTAEQVRLEMLMSMEGKRSFIDRFILNPKILTKTFIDTFSEMGMQFQAHFINKMQLINVRKLVPNIANKIDEIVFGKNGVGGIPLPEGLPAKEAKELQELIVEYALSDPALLDQIPGLLTAKNVALADLKEEFMPFGLIEENYKELIYQLHRTGELYSNTDEVFKMLEEMQVYQLLRSPEFWSQKFDEIAETFLKEGLNNPEAFMKGLQTVEALTDFYSEVARILKREATLYGRTLHDPVQKAAYHAEVDALLERFLSDGDNSMVRISRALEENIRHSGLTVAQQNEVLRLVSFSQQYRNQIRTIITERNAIRQGMINTTPAGKRTDEWWKTFYEASDEPWNRQRDFIFRLDADRHSSAAVISEAHFKPLRDAGGGLSIQHLAELWGVNPEGLHKGLFDLTMGVMIPKEMFVGWQYQRAQKIALHFGVAPEQVDDYIRAMGYTEENIGRVFDQMCANLHLDYTTGISALSPRIMQLESMKQVVGQLSRNTAWPEGTNAAIRQYINAVKSRLEGVPGYLATKAARPSTIKYGNRRIGKVGLEHFELLEEGGEVLHGTAADIEALSKYIDDICAEFPDEMLRNLEIIIDPEHTHWKSGVRSAGFFRRGYEYIDPVTNQRVVKKDAIIIRGVTFDPERGVYLVLDSEDFFSTRLDLVIRHEVTHKAFHDLFSGELPRGGFMEDIIRGLVGGEGDDFHGGINKLVLDFLDDTKYPPKADFLNTMTDEAKRLAMMDDLELIDWIEAHIRPYQHWKEKYTGINLGQISYSEVVGNGEVAMIDNLHQAYLANFDFDSAARLRGLIRPSPSYRKECQTFVDMLQARELQLQKEIAESNLEGFTQHLIDNWRGAYYATPEQIAIQEAVAEAGERYARVIAEGGTLDDLTPVERMIAERFPVAGLEKAEAVPGATISTLHPDFIAAKEEAMSLTRQQYSRVFADYMVEDQNFIDDFIRSIFPYFPYQFHRPQWLLENSLKYPGIPVTLSKYQNYTDRGYIHIPGTSIEFNPFRGTIFANIVARLSMRDVPEYTDAFPNLAQGLDYMSRAGFYPGFPVQLGMTLFGAGDPNRRPQWGQLLPATHRTILNTITAICPEEVSKPLRELIFPDYFRDYQIVLAVCRRGGQGAEIYRKKLANEPLTDDENAIWEAAAREISAHGIYFEQMALLRFRPEEMNQAYAAASAVIEDRTGIPQDVQDYYRKLGLNLWDYFPPLDPETQRIINEMESMKNWSGVTMPLQPTLIQKDKILQEEFWTEVENSNEIYKWRQEELDSRFLLGGITVDQWVSRTSDNNRDKANSIDTLHRQDRYKNVPLTLEERLKWYEERGEAPPPLHPMKEILYLWYAIEPEEVYDAEVGAFVINWDEYYAKQDAILLALPDNLKEEFLDYINANKTPLQLLHWQVSRDFIRPYNNLRYYAMQKFSPEEQAIIEEWYATASLDNRRYLESLTNAEGNTIVGTYRRYKEELGIRLRTLDPELDAWLFFFGITSTFRTGEAEEIYRSLCREYGRQLP